MSRTPFRNTVVSVPCALALCAFALLPSGTATAATHTVGNCNDSGPGSLRNVVANAASGDTIDLTSLACSRIVLTNRGIQVPQDDLNVVGRHREAITIDGNRNSRVFVHTGTGTLRLRRVSIANGYVTGSEVVGGCIRSLGGVELIGSRLHHCEVRGQGGLKPFAGGGGISANRVLLSWSSAYSNVAASSVFNIGGAVHAGEIVLYRSQVYGNRARQGGGVWGRSVTATSSVISGNEGGGIDISSEACRDPATVCRLTLSKSTVSANEGGGIWAYYADDAAIIESTVSDNVASYVSAAILPSDGETRIFNSTIAFNQNRPTGPSAECRGAIEAFQLLRLESSIIARNTCSLGDDNDIYGDPSQGARIVGGNNIIGNSDLPVPPDTILARPRLGPLTDNGGPTPTRKPQADSPALDRGSNPLNHQYDQRGSGFPRVKGGFPDIGAVER